MKKIKSETSLDTSCSESGWYNSESDQEAIVAAVEQQLEIQTDIMLYENISVENLRNANIMFVYLMACPFEMGFWFKSLDMFFKNLFETESPYKIILTLNRMIKNTNPGNEDGKIWAVKLFIRASRLLSLKYKEIESMLAGATTDADGETYDKTNNSESVNSNNSRKDVYSKLIVSSIVNHPVHIITKDNLLSPSAFVPFCEFGGNMSTVGKKVVNFSAPVCNSFQAKLLNDQLCYEVDLSKLSNKDNIVRELELGFTFLMDYNYDRQVQLDKKHFKRGNFGLTSSIMEKDEGQHATIYLDTIGISISTRVCSTCMNGINIFHEY